MKKIYILFIWNFLIPANLFSQTKEDSGFLRIGSNFKLTELEAIELESIVHLCFTESKLANLDTIFERFKNVKTVTFQQNAVIPSNLGILSNAFKVNFTQYTEPINFPCDFPYLLWHQIIVSGVQEMPIEMENFNMADSLFVFKVDNVKTCSVIGDMLKLKVLNISEVGGLDLGFICHLDSLESLEIDAAKLMEPICDLTCSKSLVQIHFEDTNLESVSIGNRPLKKIILKQNALNELEVQRLLKLAPLTYVEIVQ